MRNKRGTELPSNALTLNWNNKRVVTQNFDGTGPPMRQKSSKEFAMEVYMNRKQRYYGEKHNPMSDSDVKYSMSCTSEVDHSIAIPKKDNSEYTVGFYKGGGIIPGSTNTLKPSAQPTLRKSNPIGGSDSNSRTMVSYAEIAAQRERDYEVNQVRLLNNESSNLGRRVPGWEEKTGLYLVTPDMEKD